MGKFSFQSKEEFKEILAKKIKSFLFEESNYDTKEKMRKMIMEESIEMTPGSISNVSSMIEEDTITTRVEFNDGSVETYTVKKPEHRIRVKRK